MLLRKSDVFGIEAVCKVGSFYWVWCRLGAMVLLANIRQGRKWQTEKKALAYKRNDRRIKLYRIDHWRKQNLLNLE